MAIFYLFLYICIVRKLLFLLLLFSLSAYGQKRNNIWCFGDSAGINFNFSIPQTFTSQCNTRGSATSISDTSGNLILYTAETPWGTNTKRTRVFNNQNQIIQNGDSIVGLGWYKEHVIIPNPGNPNQFYLFSAGVTSDYGLYYSIIDMSLNGGLGAVIQKNIQLLPYQIQDGVQGIKHGNGSDWWIFCHRWDIDDNHIYRFLIGPAGITGPFIQTLADTSLGSFFNLTFSPTGHQAAITDYAGLFQLFDFDRCTGEFSVNPMYNFTTSSTNYYDFWSSAFSPDENFLYIGTSEVISYLFQLNLNDSDPWSTRDTLWIENSMIGTGGYLRLAPDNKIYYACAWYDGVHYNYPYPDSAHYTENENLGVINQPDSLGAQCNFQPYSFYLGGNRCYWGLPNNSDYDLGPDTGSMCDTILNVSIAQVTSWHTSLNAYYKADWQICYLNANNLSGRKYKLIIFDQVGKEIFKDEGTLLDKFFSKNLYCSNLSTGIYTAVLITDKENLSKRFVKN